MITLNLTNDELQVLHTALTTMKAIDCVTQVQSAVAKIRVAAEAEVQAQATEAAHLPVMDSSE